MNFARGYISKAERTAFIQSIYRCDIVVFRLVKHIALGDSTGSYYPDDITLNNAALCVLRVGELFAYSDFITCIDKLFYVNFTGVIRDTAHWRTFFKTAVTSCKCEFKNS